MRKAFISMLAYDEKICAVTVASLMNEVLVAAESGIVLSTDIQMRCSDLPFGRAMCLSRFLASGAEDWVCIDNDVGWDSGGLTRLLTHDVEFVMGVYPKRQSPADFVVNFPPGGMKIETNGLARITAGPAGFMRLKRSAVEKMIQGYRELIYRNEDSPTMGKLWGVFEKVVENGERVSEDISFVHRWVKLGEPAWVDPSIKLYHAGMNIWEGTLLDHVVQKRVAA